MPPRPRTRNVAPPAEPPSPSPRPVRRRRAPRPADRTPTPPPSTPAPRRRRRRQQEPSAEPDDVPIPDPQPAGSSGAPTAQDDVHDNVFTRTPTNSPRVNVRFNNAQSDGEFFPSPSPSPPPSPSPSPSTNSATNRPPPTAPRSRHRGSPRAGSHATPPRAHPRQAGSRSASAKDVWTFIEGEGEHTKECLFCKQKHQANPRHNHRKIYSSHTSTGVLRKHLYSDHLDVWVAACDQLNIHIKAKEAKPFVDDYRARQGQSTTSESERPQERRTQFSQEAFVDAIVEFIVADDQSINVIENQQLRAIFLMLRAELRDSDIPHRSTIRKRILEVWDEHLDKLEHEMGEAIGKISTTMDMWTDTQKIPYMAVTGHWLQAEEVSTPFGPQYKLTLRSDLIGFLRVPGHHDGEHLAAAFVHIIDRIRIAHKLGWVTLDNASNNDTFMLYLERELVRRGIPFCKFRRRIRCFPHIVNLACKAVLAAITNMDFAAPEAADFVPQPGANPNRDPVATVRTIVRVIRASSLRRQYFSEILKALQTRNLQLLRDVDTRWSSTLLMIDRAILLREAINRFLAHDEFRELHKYQLTDQDWAALEAFRRILSVPHAFQQKLSAESTPTLGRALPAFEAMIRAWEKQQVQFPETRQIIQEGIDKLGSYQERVENVPAYIFAMILNPAVKLSWFQTNRPDQTQWAKDLFMAELDGYRKNIANTPARPRNTNWADEVLGLDSPERPIQSRSLQDEVESYLVEGLYQLGPVHYWEENQLRYPTLFMFALDILPIQGSAVPCERVFSSSAETDTARRNRIAPELMEALQMLKFSIKRGRALNFTQGTTREEELTGSRHERQQLSARRRDQLQYFYSIIACHRGCDRVATHLA